MDLSTFRTGLDLWLDEHADALEPEHHGLETLEQQMAQLAKLKRLGYQAGWMRWGWPESAGGLGGSTILRAYLGEALTYRGLVEPGVYSMAEVLAPTVINFATPELLAEVMPPLLRGDEYWCQGFSEPATGSNLGSLTCRAERTAEGWRVRGQKLWTSYAQFSQRCVLLTRTGPKEAAHRALTALFVDMDSPGIVIRPLKTQHGVEEFSEVFYDDVLVPFERTLGDVDGGWTVAMDLLPYERSTSLWHKCAYLQRRFNQLLDAVLPGVLSPTEIAEAAQLLCALRARSRATQHRVAAGEQLGPETSIDKILVASAEQAVFDLVGTGLAGAVITADDEDGHRWRTEYLYSRAATIYGGSSEIQRNIIARRLLNLGPDR